MPDPNSSAVRLAAQVDMSEPVQDQRLRNISHHDYEVQQVTDKLLEAGLQLDVVEASSLRRVARGIRGLDDAGVADAIERLKEQVPGWFTQTPKTTRSRTADRLVGQFLSGETAPRRGGVH